MKELSLEKMEEIDGGIGPCATAAIGLAGLLVTASLGPAGGLVYLAFVGGAATTLDAAADCFADDN